MAIASVADLLASMPRSSTFIRSGANFDAGGSSNSMWLRGTYPAGASAPSPGINGANCSRTTAGALVYENPASGNSYFSGFDIFSTDNACILLCDRLWHNSSISATTTTEQAISMSALPARDRNGADDGEDVMAWLEVSGATGAGGSVTNTTLRYTNSAGTDTRTATLTHTGAGGLAVGYSASFALQAGDKGIQSIQGLTLGTTYSSGTMHLVLARVIALIPVWHHAGGSSLQSAIQQAMPRVYDDSCLYFIQFANSSGLYDLNGTLRFAQG